MRNVRSTAVPVSSVILVIFCFRLTLPHSFVLSVKLFFTETVICRRTKDVQGAQGIELAIVCISALLRVLLVFDPVIWYSSCEFKLLMYGTAFMSHCARVHVCECACT